MIGLCSKCGNLAELHYGLCCICKMEKEITDSKDRKNPEAVVKNTLRKIAGIHKEASTVVKEGGGE